MLGWNRRRFETIVLGLTCLLVSCGTGGGAGGSAFPLKVSPDNRYLVDQNDDPFLLIGDAPQALMVNALPSEARLLLANRASNGFNTVWIMLLCNDYSGGRADSSTVDGLKPFTRTGDLSTPNEAYFSRCDEVIRAAASEGLLVLLDPIDTGGFLDMMRANGETKCLAYGRFLGTRYKGFDNILWMSGSDFQTWRDAGDDALVRAVASGIREADARHIQTVELDYYSSLSTDDPSWSGIISLNAAYTYYPTYAEVLAGYDRIPTVPVFLVEADYELENDAGPERLRRQEYWSLLSGACGHVFGNEFVWPLLSGWQSHLDSTGVKELGYCRSLLRSRPWHTLVPDQGHALVTAGTGTFSSGGTPHTSISENNYVTAAATPDGRLGLVYVPSTRTITVDLTVMSGPVTARWYDPTAGTYRTIDGSPFANSSSQSFSTPGTHSDGASDWVLVLETS
jgi:hypothetical protein